MPLQQRIKVDREEIRQAFDRVDPSRHRAFLRRVQRNVSGRLTEIMERELKSRIHGGVAEGPPLSAEWARRKGHNRPWFHEGELRSAVTRWRIGDTWVVGIPTGKSHYSGMTAYALAAFLEGLTPTLTSRSAGKIPPRPLFRPAYEWLQSSGLVGTITQAVLEQERKKEQSLSRESPGRKKGR